MLMVDREFSPKEKLRCKAGGDCPDENAKERASR
jgi:hypothetical protein